MATSSERAASASVSARKRCSSVSTDSGVFQAHGPYRLSFPPVLPSLRLFQLSFESLRVSVLSVLVKDVHQVRDVTGSQPQSLDLGQFGVGRDVGDTFPQLRKGRVDALGPPPLLPVGRGSPLHSARMCVMVHADSGSVHRDGTGSRN